MALAVRTAIRLSSSYAFSSDARSDRAGGRYGLRGRSVCGIMDFDVPIWAICFLDIVGESPILQPASQSGAGCPFCTIDYFIPTTRLSSRLGINWFFSKPVF